MFDTTILLINSGIFICKINQRQRLFDTGYNDLQRN